MKKAHGILHSCDQCEYSTSRKNHLKAHINTVHDGIEPNMCDICQQTFTNKSYINVHKKEVHGK